MASRVVRPLRQRRWRASTVILYSVVILGSIATFVHSSWGFATIEATLFEGIDPTAWSQSGWFWARGALAATTLDLGILGLIRLIQEGGQPRRTYLALTLVALLSGFTQFLYASAHAVVLEPTAGVAGWLSPTALLAAQARLVLLPWALPGLIIMYGFTVRPPRRPTVERAEEVVVRALAPMHHDAGETITYEPPQRPLGI